METLQPVAAPQRVIGIPFTTDNARLMALRSVEVRRQRKDQPKTSAISGEPSTLEPAESFHNRMIARVREEMERILGDMSEEDDPNKKDRLASAFDKLRDSERVLLGQPLPGSRRPSPEKTKRSTPEAYNPVE